MRLVNASRVFDKTTIRDAYTNVALFKGQISAYIDSKVDGSISRRRVISLAPDLVIPTRRALKYTSEVWVVGDGLKDNVQNVDLRISYVAARCTDLYSLLTPAQAALNTTSGITTFYGQAEYLKAMVNGLTDSEYDNQYKITYSSSESVDKNSILRLGTKLYTIRSTHKVLEGFKISEADELDYTLQTAVFSTGSYNSITDTYGSGTATTTGLLLDMYQIYEYRTQADPKNLPGDMTLIVAQSAVTPLAGQRVTVAGTWQIESVVPYLDAWNLHLRRA